MFKKFGSSDATRHLGIAQDVPVNDRYTQNRFGFYLRSGFIEVLHQPAPGRGAQVEVSEEDTAAGILKPRVCYLVYPDLRITARSLHLTAQLSPDLVRHARAEATMHLLHPGDGEDLAVVVEPYKVFNIHRTIPWLFRIGMTD